MTVFLAGFSLGLSLILPIGSQNAFVLKQGLKKQYVAIVVTTCAVSDAILIGLGVAGFGSITKTFPEIETIARYGGAIFLTCYALFSFKSALTKNHVLDSGADLDGAMIKAVLMCLAFTWLNPHVYLDTVVLLGSISTQYHPNQIIFAIGAMSASTIFFVSLGFGARFLAPLFKSSRSWKVLDFCIGLVMISIAISLVA